MALPRTSRVALVFSALLTLLFIVWTIRALSGGELQEFDDRTALGFHEAAQGHDTRRELMVAITHVGGVAANIILALVGVTWQLSRGDKVLALAWALIVAGGGALNWTLKETLNRDRPPREWRDAAVTEDNESFPSGHSMGSLIGYGVLGYAALHCIRRRDLKIVLVLCLAALVAAIGFSRIYLRAHWFSDVVGGFLVGAAWLSFGLAWVPWARARRSVV